ncbi:hypothetical protein AMTRI_Chr03g55730 [Amborella trichopoda]|uniref:Ketoreductase domain-containing protein n=1 Tax=Amborella trichopoda TaxID=13333 RepID=W1NDH6_AMBTC|nr:short-chain type dehydrogenase/reductase [Amborella trichopoda]ERM93542.1 hypothetical protein AMTR_s00004p00075960 [Amborella trichopoda]|eukprot:XP_006826305.1 short-chain type dehydrogenase/reductase [Amborella trichopoda]
MENPRPIPAPQRLHPLAGRVAIVTGGSGGIGAAVAQHLATLGAQVAITYSSSPGKADALVQSINSDSETSSSPPTTAQPRATAIKCDITDPVQVQSLFDQASQILGPDIHILVNSAGILDPNYPTIATTPLEDWDRTFSTNTRGAFLCAREAARRLVKGGGGRIIMFTSSAIGVLRVGFGAYAASKSAVETMTKTLAKELRGTRITANCVAPGPVATEMFFAGKNEDLVKKITMENPLERLGEIGDVAPVIGFLASDEGEWINGQVIRVNGGLV